jgi:hypothetical protein
MVLKKLKNIIGAAAMKTPGGVGIPKNKPVTVSEMPVQEPIPDNNNIPAAVDKVKPVTPEPPKVLRNEQGEITGAEFPNNKGVILGNERDIRPLINNFIERRQAPAGSVEASAVAAEQARQEQIQQSGQLAGQVGQIGGITQEPLTPLDLE